MGVADPPCVGTQPVDALDRWAAFLGTTLALASLGLVALADFGWFRLSLALVVVAGAGVGAAFLWRPPLRGQPTWSGSTLLATAVLAVGTALIAPGSENVAGPRDPAVYVATGFAIAHGGGMIIRDPALQLLATTTDPSQIDSWLYTNAINGARIRFPAQLFIHDVESGRVEGGFLPVLPVWMALAAVLGGTESALHVAGVFGILALAFAMLATREVSRRGETRTPPLWQLVGAILAVSFSQVWWAREPMAESALGAFTWLTAWATIRWLGGGGPRWAVLAGIGTAAALFTRADAILLAGALGLLLVRYSASGRGLALGLLATGLAAAAFHDALIAPVYTSAIFGGVTASRAAVGIGAVAALGIVLVAAPGLARFRGGLPWTAAIAGQATALRRGAVLLFVGLALASALTGVAPGVDRAAGLGAASPLAWLPGYVPWPLLAIAAIGAAAWGWNGVTRPLVPLLLIGGLPALLYLPDPLVTGDHPWMVRRLVPSVIPLLAVAASAGAVVLWRLRLPRPAMGIHAAGPVAAAMLTGLGLGLAIAHDRDLVGPRHGAGALAGLTALAADLPPNALVLFPAGQAGLHLALPLDLDFGVAAYAIPLRAVSPTMASTLSRIEATGRIIYWAEDGVLPPILPGDASAVRDRTTRVHYKVADNGPVPPPLQLREVNHDITLYRLSFAGAMLGQVPDGVRSSRPLRVLSRAGCIATGSHMDRTAPSSEPRW